MLNKHQIQPVSDLVEYVDELISGTREDVLESFTSSAVRVANFLAWLAEFRPDFEFYHAATSAPTWAMPTSLFALGQMAD